jgi:hypothetical protein
MTNIEKIVKEFSESADADGVPNLSTHKWKELNSDYTKQEIKEGLASYIINHKPKFPFRKIELSTVKNKFASLSTEDLSHYIITPDKDKVLEKYNDYKYPYSKHGLFLIDNGHYYNDISNYFQQENRLSCPSYGFASPIDIWNDHDLLMKMNWIFWRMGTTTINETNIRGSFRLGAYVATQFKPHVATVVYDLRESKRVLDLSMGWGDRLAGFYASRATHYYGCDPNPKSFELYKQQVVAYESFLGNTKSFFHQIDEHTWLFEGIKTVYMQNLPAEDSNVFDQAEMDCVFTSPPYYSTELYNKGGEKEENQSWHRYPDYTDWLNKFYLPVMKRAYNSLSYRGMMMINIMDPTIKGKRYRTCDEMVDYIKSIGGKFIGQVGMKIKQRPKKMEKEELLEHLSADFIENIWCFSKTEYKWVSKKRASLEHLME